MNSHHSKGASAVLVRRISVMQTGLALIQEPWLYWERISGLSGCGSIYKGPLVKAPRACIAVKGMDVILVLKFCSRDLTVIKVRLRVESGERLGVAFASAYFPDDADGSPPAREVEILIQYCQKSKILLLLGCDASSHHSVWGITNINDRGRDLIEYLAVTDMEILNRGDTPICQVKNRSEVFDLTLCSERLRSRVVDWRVSNEESLSDHKYIPFQLNLGKPVVSKVKNPRNTLWDSYKEELRGRLVEFLKNYDSIDE
ncbi:uncharacterized protein LOC117180668 [Belonocnema kinseyi]|uniref:uncharacterized protein LOC117180668 n=1 Tax=Belonocnema kinseyi TaxID=2817044 RepID=UPI00143CED99|nr:uncharacterized protein LOC117180668 [Belonocnema kinseyi]